MRFGRRSRTDDAQDDAPAPDQSEPAAEAPKRRQLRANRIESSTGDADGAAPEATAHEELHQEPASEVPTVEDQHEVHASEGSGPTPSPPAAKEPRKGRIRALLDEQVAQSREESERQAAEELRQFMEPARQQLLLNVPGSSSPEEAEAMLASQSNMVLASPAPANPDEIDLRHTSSMRAYPEAEKLSNRVLRLADRHWAKPKVRPSAEVVAEKTAIAERDFARKPAGTQRCLAMRGSLRCRGVFAFHGDDQDGAGIIACPTCGSAHTWSAAEGDWVLTSEAALASTAPRSSLTSGG